MELLENYQNLGWIEVFEGADLTELLGIQKWEAPIPACLAGTMRGNFPSFIPKTDQERIQNLGDSLEQWSNPKVFTWEETEKLEGSSMTIYRMDDYFGVCSRNMDLLKDESNTFWVVAIRDQMEEKLKNYPGNIAVQGELIGPGIQGNIYGLTQPEFRVFDIYDIDIGDYMLPEQRRYYASALGFTHVPVMAQNSSLEGMTMADILKHAEGDSVLIPANAKKREREGVVFK
jgi:RNA ligase (TIGR02306 family)